MFKSNPKEWGDKMSKSIQTIVKNLIVQLQKSELGQPTAAGEWDWLNLNKRHKYCESLYTRNWDELTIFLLDPLSAITAYGFITPVNNTNQNPIFNNDFLNDLSLFRSMHPEEYAALKHKGLLIHPYSSETAKYDCYPDSPRHAHFALKVIQSAGRKGNGVEIGGGYGGLIYFLTKFGFGGKLINCDLLETLLVAFIFLEYNGVCASLCLSQEQFHEAIEGDVKVILITPNLFELLIGQDRYDFVFNSRSFSEMSPKDSKFYLKKINNHLIPDFVFSENAEELLFTDSERHLEVTQEELSQNLSNYSLVESERTNFMGGAARYTLRTYRSFFSL